MVHEIFHRKLRYMNKHVGLVYVCSGCDRNTSHILNCHLSGRCELSPVVMLASAILVWFLCLIAYQLSWVI